MDASFGRDGIMLKGGFLEVAAFHEAAAVGLCIEDLCIACTEQIMHVRHTACGFQVSS